MVESVDLIECPRDAIQGWAEPISTALKIRYINALLKVGFHTLDFGSFVSPRAIPQMADTLEVLEKLELNGSGTKLLAIIANLRGAEEASAYDKISYLGFPFSVSETFQRRNANSGLDESFERVKVILDECNRTGKEMVVYLSMAFGNPYGDPYSEEWVLEWAKKMAALGVRILSLADTVGLAKPAQVRSLTESLINNLPDQIIGVHLHSTPANYKEKIDAALGAGCRRFDGALKGIGGCPMAADELVGNIETEWMVDYLKPTGINMGELENCLKLAGEVFHL
jgi:hydroxymethylglutaryl-CoA lyase